MTGMVYGGDGYYGVDMAVMMGCFSGEGSWLLTVWIIGT